MFLPPLRQNVSLLSRIVTSVLFLISDRFCLLVQEKRAAMEAQAALEAEQEYPLEAEDEPNGVDVYAAPAIARTRGTEEQKASGSGGS